MGSLAMLLAMRLPLFLLYQQLLSIIILGRHPPSMESKAALASSIVAYLPNSLYLALLVEVIFATGHDTALLRYYRPRGKTPQLVPGWVEGHIRLRPQR